jgi:hypothetical protein
MAVLFQVFVQDQIFGVIFIFRLELEKSMIKTKQKQEMHHFSREEYKNIFWLSSLDKQMLPSCGHRIEVVGGL